MFLAFSLRRYFFFQEGLLSLYRGGKHDLTSLGLEKFRNSEVEDLEAGHLGGGARRMSITNAIDILRERVLRAIKKKKDREVLCNISNIGAFAKFLILG